MIGEFDKRLTLKNPTLATSVTGGTSNSGYTTVTTVWAKFKQKSGSLETDSQGEIKKTYEAEFRKSTVIDAALTVSTVINDGVSDYSIINIDNSANKVYYKVVCVTK